MGPDHLERHPDRILAALACDPRIPSASSWEMVRVSVIGASKRGRTPRQSSVQATAAGSMGPNVRFSNRPFGVKHFQTIHHCNIDVARGLVLLFGIGTWALPSWDSKTRRNNLLVGLAVSRTAGPSGHANSPHPSSREGHPSAAGWISLTGTGWLKIH